MSDISELPTAVVPSVSSRVERYARWLKEMNALPQDNKLRLYQETSLRSTKVGKRTVTPFAPFRVDRSALRVVSTPQKVGLVVSFLLLIVSLVFWRVETVTILLSIATCLYVLGFTISALLATTTLREDATNTLERDIKALDALGVQWPTYTILCPLYKEALIVPQFVEAMQALDYPQDRLQVLLLTEENDRETRDELFHLSLPSNFTILTVPFGSPQTKPRACNFGLLQAKGQFVVIYDAEDKPSILQLKEAILTFAQSSSDVACVQAKLNYYNSRQNLLTRWFTAEYSTWYDLMLFGLHKTAIPLPLGGTSNHFRTDVLRALGGWDAFNVTEDCDLGLRLTQYGLKTAVLDSTTYEEATSTVKGWLRQRSRWIKGYMQTYLVHMRRPFKARSVKWLTALQLVVGAWTFVLLVNPIMWALTALYIIERPTALYHELFPGPILYLGAICLIFGNFFYVYIHLIGCLKRHEYSLVPVTLLLPIYWLLMSIAAYMALVQLIIKPHYWEKTQHGLHLKTTPQAQRTNTPPIELEQRAVHASMPTQEMPVIIRGKMFKTVSTNATLDSATERIPKIGRGAKIPQQGATDVLTVRSPMRIVALSCTVLLCLCATSYYLIHQQLLIYGDAHSHVDIARRFFDSTNAYDVTQLGAVWLPLPHVLMWPFVWNDYLWRSGLAGSIVSGVCYVWTAYYIYQFISRLTCNNAASLLGVLVFASNPDVLYVQATPLSEMVCALTFIAGCYYFLCWLTLSGDVKYLLLSGLATFFATLSRYDGWALFLVLLFGVLLGSALQRYRAVKVVSSVATFVTLGGLGIGLWLLWSQIIFGDALYFQNGPYSSQEQQLSFLHAGALFTYHNMSLAIWYYLADVVETIGPIICIVAVIGLVSLLITTRSRTVVLGCLPLCTPLAFYVASLYSGQAIIYLPGIVPSSVADPIFNARYGIAMVPGVAIFAAYLFSRIRVPRRQLRIVLQVSFAVLLLSQVFLTSTGGNVALQDGQSGHSCQLPLRVNAYLAAYYTDGYVLEDNFTTRIDGIDTGISFHDMIYEGSGDLWRAALKNPEKYATWVVAYPDNPADEVALRIPLRSASFLANFSLAAQDVSGIYLYHNKHTQMGSPRKLPIDYLQQYKLCKPH